MDTDAWMDSGGPLGHGGRVFRAAIQGRDSARVLFMAPSFRSPS